MAAIDIGAAAISRMSSGIAAYTQLVMDNPANASGIIDTIEVWVSVDASATSKVGTFHGSGTSWTKRDYATIGPITAGSKQTFSGLDIDVETDDLIGFFDALGKVVSAPFGGAGVLSKWGDQFDAGTQTYSVQAGDILSLYGYSVDAPTVTTQAAVAVDDVTVTGNGNITDIGSGNATRRGFCYMVGVVGDPTTANSVAYDDGDFGTGAYSKAITGLSPETNYRVRAYAVNPVGTSYGITVQITTGVLETILIHSTLATGAETALTDCAEHTDLSRVTSMSLRVEMTFEASVDADPTVSVFASTEDDNDEYDTTAWKTWTFTRSAGNTVALYWPSDDEIRPLPKYIKAKVKNNSGAGANTSITSITVKKVVLEL